MHLLRWPRASLTFKINREFKVWILDIFQFPYKTTLGTLKWSISIQFVVVIIIIDMQTRTILHIDV